jgi:hypothetical protein
VLPLSEAHLPASDNKTSLKSRLVLRLTVYEDNSIASKERVDRFAFLLSPPVQ